jgi:hypothetical protein
MFIALLTLLSALSISGVAIFYSVIGLATIFPGAFWPVVIMGGVLEVGKLVTASWLYRNWRFTRWLLRTYLTIAVVILSIITSMGIFGFLSKAHLEQNLAEDTVTQRIEIINSKIASEETYIERQKDSITRLEVTLDRTTDSNTGALDIEIQGLKDAENKFKTLLAVETNTVEDLNSRMRTLDKDVSDVLTANKQFFNEEKAAAALKESQKEERDGINSKILAAQERIAILKEDYARDTDKIQKRIDALRQSNVADNSGVTADITKAEGNILAAQNRIDDLIVEREPLQSDMLKLEAEVGPVKYIAALAVDFGWTDSVNTSEAVRWVILIIIVVFDPLAVLLLIAANQSLMRRFPPEPPKPQEILDLEKPDDEDVTLKWNDVINKQNAAAKMEQATEQLREWKEKLEAFNSKVEKPEDKPVEIIQEDDPDNIPHIELNGQKKTEDEEIGVDKELQEMQFDRRDIQWEKKLLEVAREAREEEQRIKKEQEEEEEKQKKIRDFLEEQAKEDEITRLSMLESRRQAEERKAKEQDRIKPDLTEVIEPETPIQEVKPENEVKNAKPLVMRTIKEESPPKPTLPDPAEMTDDERKKILDVFHNQNGKFEDITNEELKMERDESNRAQYLADVSLSESDARAQGAITESRMAFFQDMMDDILRGDLTFENVPEENRKIIAQIMDPNLPNPPIITKGSALKEKPIPGIDKTTAEVLKEKFIEQPDLEDRPMTDEELDELLDGYQSDAETVSGKTRTIIKGGQRIKVPLEDDAEKYVQNEEQNEDTLWNKSKELDLPEPEKNDLLIPELQPTIKEDEVPELAESISVDKIIPEEKFTKYKKRLTSEEDYHQRVEARINDLITKLDSKEIKLSDLSDEDQQVIIDILNQNE